LPTSDLGAIHQQHEYRAVGVGPEQDIGLALAAEFAGGYVLPFEAELAKDRRRLNLGAIHQQHQYRPVGVLPEQDIGPAVTIEVPELRDQVARRRGKRRGCTSLEKIGSLLAVDRSKVARLPVKLP
jgi:hypothetical protein